MLNFLWNGHPCPSEVARNTVIYGDAKWGIDAYKNSSADAMSLQAGVGYRF